MLNFNFWMGFSIGIATMFLIALAITIWFVVQAANFHDSWLDKKDKK